MASSSNLSWKEGLKPRKPTGLLRGKEYRIDKLLRDVSLYNSMLIAVYTDFKMKFHTYLPKSYDNKDDAHVERLNQEIKEGKNIRIKFYGCIGTSNELYIHEDDERKCLLKTWFYLLPIHCMCIKFLLFVSALDVEKLEGVKLIEESERSGHMALLDKVSLRLEQAGLTINFNK